MKSNRERVAGDLDSTVFGSNEPEVIETRFRGAYEAQQTREATFGGYLRALRRRREKTVIEIASQAGVPAMRWSQWEGNESLPSPDLLDQVIGHLFFGPEKREKLYRLLKQARQHSVQELSLFCFEKLAAKGSQRLEARGEWESFSPDLQSLLLEWGKRQGLRMPDQLFDTVGKLRTDEERKDWIRQVFGDDEGL